MSSIDDLLNIFEDVKEKITDNEYKTGLESVSKLRDNLIASELEKVDYKLTIWYQSPYIRQSIVAYEFIKIVVIKKLDRCTCNDCLEEIPQLCKYRKIYQGTGASVSVNCVELSNLLDIDFTGFIDDETDMIVVSQKA